MMKYYILLSGSIVLGAVAQIFFKRGAMAIESIKGFFSGNILFGLLLYVIATVFYLLVLKKIPLSVAYPMFALGYALTVILGCTLFGEAITLFKVLGILFIFLGVGLIGQSV